MRSRFFLDTDLGNSGNFLKILFIALFLLVTLGERMKRKVYVKPKGLVRRLVKLCPNSLLALSGYLTKKRKNTFLETYHGEQNFSSYRRSTPREYPSFISISN